MYKYIINYIQYVQISRNVTKLKYHSEILIIIFYEEIILSK
jgi:hypothetical protein